MKQYRVNGLSFEEEIRGETLPFGKKIIYLGLNGVLQHCNWACRYCLEGSPEERIIISKKKLWPDEELTLVDKAADLGIRGLLITGGEPLAPIRKESTFALACRAHEKGLVPLIYTNGSYIDQDLADTLADNGASIALKVDSLVPKKYDRIAQKKGAYDTTMKAIEIIKKTSISKPIAENDAEILVRLLFTTVGNALNVDEYISIARFATNHDARWMMESLNIRGDASNNTELTLDKEKHNESMRYALMLNPEQRHNIDKQGYCRLFYMITVNTSTGDFGICPQDYNYIGNIKKIPLKEASKGILRRVNNPDFLKFWNNGTCPIKNSFHNKEVK